jgi:hypothetical protein
MTDTETKKDETPRSKLARLLDALLRHPAGVMFVGFLLTGVVGTMLTNHLAGQRQAEAAAIAQRDADRKAVLELSRLFAEQLTRAEMLAAAIEHQAASEVIDRLKQLYDEAMTNWLLRRSEAMLLAREALGEEDFQTLRTEVETRMARKRLAVVRECFDRACAPTSAAADRAAVLRECHMAQLLAECRSCGETIIDALYDLVSISHLNPSDPQAIRVRDKVRQAIERACP